MRGQYSLLNRTSGQVGASSIDCSGGFAVLTWIRAVDNRRRTVAGGAPGGSLDTHGAEVRSGLSATHPARASSVRVCLGGFETRGPHEDRVS